MTTEGLSRRHALTGAAAVGVGLPLLAACGSDSGSTATDTPAGPGPLAPTTDIPEGGGTIFADQKVVVTQPAAGEFKCFSAVCTHQSCLLANVTDGTINCSCHGSKFSIEDGSNVVGPSGSAAGSVADLAPVKIKVAGGEISLV
ncbi:MAG: Rieske (2Fe-2S) protein [Nocardioides sp.]|nr:Rieske (2Fe-2S) protein [Nocardioides sp.]